MPVFNNALAGAAGSGGAAASYEIERSIRFEEGRSTYLSRNETTGNDTKFTWSFWIKKVGTQFEWPTIIGSYKDSTNKTEVRWNIDRLQFYALDDNTQILNLSPSRKFLSLIHI